MVDLYDEIFNEIFDPKINDLLESNSFYQKMAGPFKSAENLKKQHRENLIKFLKMKPLREDLEEAQLLILENIGQINKPNTIKKEFENIPNSLISFVKKQEMKAKSSKNLNPGEQEPFFPKEIFGISNESLSAIYNLAQNFINNNNLEASRKILTFLTIMDPHVHGFWIALGLVHYAEGHYHEAVELYDIAKVLDPNDASPYIFTLECYLQLKDKIRAKEELALAREKVKDYGDKKFHDRLEVLHASFISL